MTATAKTLGSVKLTENVITGDLSEYTKTTDLEDAYLTKTDAASTYLTKTDAAGTYATKEDISTLSGAMHFKGVATAAPSGTVLPTGVTDAGEAATAGDVVTYGDKEYVFDGTAWAELGDTSAEGTRLTALETKMATAESDIDTAQADIVALKARLEVTAQEAPDDLLTTNTVSEIMERVNNIVFLLKSAGVFK